MRAFAWNCRGLGQPRAVRELTDLVRTHRPKVVGLLKIKIDGRRLEPIRRRLGLKHGIIVERRGLAGGLALLWAEDVEIRILSYSQSHIDALVENAEDRAYRITIFYGHPSASRGHISWDLLRLLNSQYNYPWVVLGDFNEIYFGWEVKGRRVRGEWQMRSFREAILDRDLADLGYRGSPFTFSNRRIGQLETKARLDRALANSEWRSLFPKAQVTHVSTSTSDHYLLLIDFYINARSKGDKLFKFEPMWLRHSDFGEIVKEAWDSSGQEEMSLGYMLKKCGENLSDWNRISFGRVQNQIKKLKNRLEVIQSLPRNEETSVEEAAIVKELDEWRLREEILWRQRSRVEWLMEGDRNTSFFHARASQRKKRNRIDRLQNDNGVWMTEEKEITGHIARYFRNLFSSSNFGNRIDWSKYLADVPKKLPDSKASYLCEPITELEVQAALFQMCPTKAPGLDGCSDIFFQKYWRVVRNTVFQKVVRMINEGKLEKGINETMIVLVPKCKKPKRVEEYRPITLCNVVAKIITKVLANRLKEVLPEVISESQSAFVPGRLISDNILLAHEVLHFIKTRRKQKKGYFSLKIDMSKAYDRVEWNFLAEMQRKMGFPENG